MLELNNIVKTYKTNDNLVHALRGVSLNFRENEFVAILGPSGCGKTTLLNIVGGLDRYTSGNLLVSGISTKEFSDELWDAYRNSTIGFVFQSYNLIPHLTVAENIELALSLCGESKQIRREKTYKALETVHMEDQANKKPSQLSGGQMQRVAIARALVNNPEIVLADEPTGALDSELSVEVMNILSEIAKEKLIIMVTHNDELAKAYCSRIVKLRDGQVEYDTNPLEAEAIAETQEKNAPVVALAPQEPQKKGLLYKIKLKMVFSKLKLDEKSAELIKKLKLKKKKSGVPFKNTSMGFSTAMGLSLKNLITKKRRTFLTSFAGSIGIIGLGLVLSLANGFNVFIYEMQTSILASVPISIYEYSMDYSVMTKMFQTFEPSGSNGSFPTDNKLHLGDKTATGGIVGDMLGTIMKSVSQNDISPEFTKYLQNMNPEWAETINYYYGVQMNVLAKSRDKLGAELYQDVSPAYVETSAITIATTVLGGNGQEPTNWHQLMDNPNFIDRYYEVLEGHFPQTKEEIVLVVDANNTVQVSALADFGIDVYQRDASGAVITNAKGNPLLRDDIEFKDLINQEFKLVLNNDYYTVEDNIYKKPKEDTLSSLYGNQNNLTLKISGVLRARPTSEVNMVGDNLCYTSALSDFLVKNAHNSNIARAQQAILDAGSSASVFGGNMPSDQVLTDNILQFVINKLARTSFLKSLGVIDAPTYINIYPTSFETKNSITDYINAWNTQGGDVSYFDISEMFIHNLRVMVDLMTYVLIVVASISLVVSSIMISVITSNSVVERTREIGILRSLGARKRDIMRVFNAETTIIGAFSGLLGIGITFALAPLGSLIIKKLAQIPGIMVFNPWHALILVGLSLALTIVSGLVPARNASKKNVVDALRSE